MRRQQSAASSSAVVELTEPREESRHPHGFCRIGDKRESLFDIEACHGIIWIGQRCVGHGSRVDRNYGDRIAMNRKTVDNDNRRLCQRPSDGNAVGHDGDGRCRALLGTHRSVWAHGHIAAGAVNRRNMGCRRRSFRKNVKRTCQHDHYHADKHSKQRPYVVMIFFRCRLHLSYSTGLQTIIQTRKDRRNKQVRPFTVLQCQR